MLRKIILGLLLVFVTNIGNVEASLLFFDDFESGTFNNWTLTTVSNSNFFVDVPSSNGVGNETIELFDTNNDSSPSLSAKFQVGKAVVENSSQMAGIILSRNIFLPGSSRLHATADVAFTHVFSSINGEPGRFDIYFDSPVVRDSVEFDEITGPNGILYDSLDLTTGLFSNPGIFSLNVRITRSALVGDTPFQYLDNVKVEALDIVDDANVVPEPVTLVLLASGLIGGACIRRKRS